MQLTIKTLQGHKFTVEAAPSNTVAEVKGIIETEKSELPAATMKLIHSGRVLKDTDTVESCNIKPNDFLVVMITKAKKPAAAAAAAAPAPAPKTPAEAPAPTVAPNAPAAPPAREPAPAPAAAAAPDDVPAEALDSLTAMGFPEAEVKACLRAANGNPDVAMEFLTNGIPDVIQQPNARAASAPAPSSGGSGAPLQALRSHPQFDALRRLVQSNPQMLQAVLTQIGQQQPELLQEINANQAAFLEMMNAPISDAPSPAPVSPPNATSSPAPAPSNRSPQGGGGMEAMMQGMGNPAQIAQMLQNMSPNELNDMAQMMGMSPEQLRAMAQMIGQIPPDQLQEYMMQGMQAGAGGAGGMLGGPQVLRLTNEEMAAVDRLTEMGFDRAEAAQAFLACDRNEALAANLLMDSGDSGGGAFGFGGDQGGPDENANDDGDGDDMYD